MSILFSPMKIGKVEMKNRIVHSATYECMAGRNWAPFINFYTADRIRNAMNFNPIGTRKIGIVVDPYLRVIDIPVVLPDEPPTSGFECLGPGGLVPE